MGEEVVVEEGEEEEVEEEVEIEGVVEEEGLVVVTGIALAVVGEVDLAVGKDKALEEDLEIGLVVMEVMVINIQVERVEGLVEDTVMVVLERGQAMVIGVLVGDGKGIQDLEEIIDLTHIDLFSF